MTQRDEPGETTAILPPHLQQIVETLPLHVDRKRGAALVTEHLYPVSHRTLETWPLPTKLVNGRAITRTITLFVVAYGKLAAAPWVMTDKHPTATKQAA